MRAKLAILMLAVTLAVPTYASAWGAKGMTEPDTNHDKNDGYMFQGSPQTAGGKEKVYFNGFTSQSIGAHAEVGSSLNPNFATLGSERQSWNGRMIAMLGVWRDCNADGFIGWGDNALFEYRAELLSATATLGGPGNSICPVQAGAPAPGHASFNFIPSHNDGQWVREFIPIGPDTIQATGNLQDANPYDLHDAGARVWADWGAPGDTPPTTRCYAFAPDGSYHSTGGFLQYADCFDGFAITDSFDTVIGAAGDPAAMSFADAPRNQYASHSALNQRNPWGTPDQGSDAKVWDCSQPAVTPHKQVNAVYGFQVSQPNTNVLNTVNTAGSPDSTFNETATGLDDCDRTNNGGPGGHQWEDDGAEVYAQETPGISITNGGGKQQTDFVLSYNEGFRNPPIPVLPAVNNAETTLGPATAKDGGTRQTETEGFYLGTTIIGEDRNPYTNREVVKEGSVFAPVQYVTSYAVLSPGAISALNLLLPAGSATGTYGAENCGAFNTGVHGGWKCDSTKWWPGDCATGYHCCVGGSGGGYACTGTIDGVTGDISISVGQQYDLRDVDCYDTSVQAARDVGVSYGALTSTKCE